MNFSWMMKILVGSVFGFGMYAQAGSQLQFKTGVINTEFQTLSKNQLIRGLQNDKTRYFVIQFKDRIRAKDKKLLIKVFDSSRTDEVLSHLRKMDQVKGQFAKGSSLGVVASFESIAKIAVVDSVRWIEHYPELEFLQLDLNSNENSDGTLKEPITIATSVEELEGYESGTKIMNFEAAWQAGWTGKDQLVGYSDTGLDVGSIPDIHEDFQGNVEKGYAYGFLGYSWGDPMGHGTHVAGSIAGNGSASEGVVKGGAFESRLIVGGMWSEILGTMIPPQDIAKMFSDALSDGAFIHSNSWGSIEDPGIYDQFAQLVDQFIWDNPEMLILFASGNSGVDADQDGRIDRDSVGSPATAKNILSVGASENLVENGGIQVEVGQLADPEGKAMYPSEPLSSDRISNNPDGIAVFSSRGPTDDGRIKPDVVAPGANILSVRSQTAGSSALWGALNEDYVWSGGTSMSTPLVAGAAAVLRQYLVEGLNITEPTSALIKGVLMQTAFDMYPGQFGTKGKSKGQELLAIRPNIHQGFGRVDMAAATSLNSDFLVDNKSGIKAGESQDHTFELGDSGDIQVTLMYTDAPGDPVAIQALVNNLDLQILVNGEVVAEGTDKINNFEHLTLEGVEGQIVIRVIGENIPTGRDNDALPYALVVNQNLVNKTVTGVEDNEENNQQSNQQNSSEDQSSGDQTADNEFSDNQSSENQSAGQETADEDSSNEDSLNENSNEQQVQNNVAQENVEF